MKRRIHFASGNMTACGKIVLGSMQVRRAGWGHLLPDWRCSACQEALRVAVPVDLFPTTETYQSDMFAEGV
jgi:hypothetical protein